MASTEVEIGMRARLEVLEGPLAGHSIEVQPGHNLSFGRTVKADIAVPGDGYMSGRHFAVENTGCALFVHDLGSSNGTFVNGQQVDRAPAAPQDLIAAGSSRFRVSYEEDTSAAPPVDLSRTLPASTRALRTPSVDASGQFEIFSRSQTALLNVLYSGAGNVFVYLNGLREPLIKAFVEASGDNFVPLLQVPNNRGGAVLSYVVALPRNSKLHKILLKEGWDSEWGVYCCSSQPLAAVAEHLRSMSVLETRSGVTLNLPLTDPRFLQVFLSGLAPVEAKAVFGPIERFFCPAAGGKSLLHFAPANGGVSVQAVQLESDAVGVR